MEFLDDGNVLLVIMVLVVEKEIGFGMKSGFKAMAMAYLYTLALPLFISNIILHFFFCFFG